MFEADDEVNIALNMAEDFGSKLQLVLQKLTSLESMVEEGVLQRFNNLESSVNCIKGEVAALSAKTDDFEKVVGSPGEGGLPYETDGDVRRLE